MSEPTLKPATDEDIGYALTVARQDGLPQFGDTFVLRLIARIRAEREAAIRECAKEAIEVAKDFAAYRDHWPHRDGAMAVNAAILALLAKHGGQS